MHQIRCSDCGELKELGSNADQHECLTSENSSSTKDFLKLDARKEVSREKPKRLLLGLTPQAFIVVVGIIVALVFMSKAQSDKEQAAARAEGFDTPWSYGACLSATQVAAESAFLPLLTQCELQESDGERAFVIQFADIYENAAKEGVFSQSLPPSPEALRTLLIENPLNLLKTPWTLVAKEGVDVYFVSFKDACQTTWAISNSQMSQFVSDQIDAATLSGIMEITQTRGCSP